MAKTLVTPKQDNAVPGAAEYRCAIIPAGKKVEVAIIVGGVEKARLGPWTGVAKPGKNAVAQVRLRVLDNSETSDFTVAAP